MSHFARGAHSIAASTESGRLRCALGRCFLRLVWRLGKAHIWLGHGVDPASHGKHRRETTEIVQVSVYGLLEIRISDSQGGAICGLHSSRVIGLVHPPGLAALATAPLWK